MWAKHEITKEICGSSYGFSQLQNFVITFNNYHFYYLKVLLGIIFKNENKSKEMLDILKQIRSYSPNLENKEQKIKCNSIPIVGDQLTVERWVNAIEAVQNSFTPDEKLEGIHMEIADWHTAATLLNVKK